MGKINEKRLVLFKPFSYFCKVLRVKPLNNKKMITEQKVLDYLKKHNPSIYYLWKSEKDLIKNSEIRDLGKLFSDPNEHIQCDWINENTILKVVKRDDFNSDANASGFDLITFDSILKIQSKLRAKGLHLEQTRRKSQKNENSSSTGHVRYSVGEADVYMFSRPDLNDYTNINSWEYIAIPESSLVDPKNSKYLLPRVPKSIWKKYVGLTKEILESEYLNKKKIING